MFWLLPRTQGTPDCNPSCPWNHFNICFKKIVYLEARWRFSIKCWAISFVIVALKLLDQLPLPTSGTHFRFDSQGMLSLTNCEEDWCITWLFSCSNRFSRVSGLTDVSIFETSFSFWFFLGVDDLVPFSVWTEVNLIVRGLWPSEHTKQAKLFDLGFDTEVH